MEKAITYHPKGTKFLPFLYFSAIQMERLKNFPSTISTTSYKHYICTATDLFQSKGRQAFLLNYDTFHCSHLVKIWAIYKYSYQNSSLHPLDTRLQASDLLYPSPSPARAKLAVFVNFFFSSLKFICFESLSRKTNSICQKDPER